MVSAATTIDPVNKYAWGANLGWMDWRGDTNNGAVIGEYVCSGYLDAANVGFDSTGPQYFYRVRAVRPLMP